jgi:hypothetical protein
MQASDEGQQGLTATAELASFQGGIEATLPLTQGVEEAEHLAVQLFGWTLSRGQTVGTLARTHRGSRHRTTLHRYSGPVAVIVEQNSEDVFHGRLRRAWEDLEVRAVAAVRVEEEARTPD